MTLASSSGPALSGAAGAIHPCGFRSPSPWRLRAGALHHPAALVFAFGLEVKHALGFHLLKSRVPEVQLQDVALARQKVILDVQPEHGFEVTAQHCRGHQFGDLRGLVAARLQLMQGIETNLPARLFFRFPACTFPVRVNIERLIPERDPRIEVPAVVVDALATCGEAGHQAADIFKVEPLKMCQSNDDIGDLDPGVVDVVLHIDLLAGGSEQTHKGVAENGIAQVADMRGLVRIDTGVLDQRVDAAGCRLLRRCPRWPGWRPSGQAGR